MDQNIPLRNKLSQSEDVIKSDETKQPDEFLEETKDYKTEESVAKIDAHHDKYSLERNEEKERKTYSDKRRNN